MRMRVAFTSGRGLRPSPCCESLRYASSSNIRPKTASPANASRQPWTQHFSRKFSLGPRPWRKFDPFAVVLGAAAPALLVVLGIAQVKPGCPCDDGQDGR